MVIRYGFNDWNNFGMKADGKFCLYDDYAALEQRFDSLSTKFSAMVEENAALEKLCGDLDNLLCEYEAKLDSIFNYVQDGVEPSDFMLSFSVVREVFDKVDQYERRCEEAERELKYIDETLARRPALDGIDSRVAKIRYAIDCARMKDKFEAENALLRKRLEPIEECYQNYDDGKLFDRTDATEAIKKAMELKEGR